MKILFYDCIGGISGDMMLGALLDAGLDFSFLKKEIQKLGIKNIQLKKRSVERNHITATKFDVSCATTKSAGSLHAIIRRIQRSKLETKVKKFAIGVYEQLAHAERKVHGIKTKDVAFEQLGEIDSLVDIVGICLGLLSLDVDSFFISDVPRSKYMAPATVALLKKRQMRFTDTVFETVTPTAAAVIKEFNFQHCSRLHDSIKVHSLGYGAGTHDPEGVSNVLRIEIAETVQDFATDRIAALESNIDDMSPETYEFLMEKLFENKNVLDVYFQPIQMKKTRPGTLLCVMCALNAIDEVAEIIFRETSSLGIRYSLMNRKKLLRKIVMIPTLFGKIKIKIGSSNGDIRSVSPEYDDCRTIARKRKVPLKVVYEEAKKEGLKRWPYQV
ncbi:nickel pincer cofactor biosynthesis protein LarC [Candidatus Omnitrophota bacterium]